MVSFGIARVVPTAAAASLFIVLVAPAAAQIRANDERQRHQIQETLSRAGPYSRELLEPLTSLGLLYQESEDYALAIATLEQAVHLVRVNEGLHALEQVPLLRQLIRIEEKRGNEAGAWEREQALLALLRRHPDDIRTVPVLRAIADKQMAILAAVLAGKRPPQVVLGCFYKEWPTRDDGSCTGGSKRTVVQGMLAEAQRNYADAIAAMLRQELYDSDDLRALELEVLRGADLVRSHYYRGRSAPLPLVPAIIGAQTFEPWRSRTATVAELAAWELPYPDAQSLTEDDGGHVVTQQLQIMDPYHRGRQSLRRLYAYGAASSGSSLRQADAVVQIADWDLLYSHNGQAVESYGVALAMLEQAGASSAAIEEQLFAPSTPIILPAFQPNPLTRDEARATGHIDVSFEITKYGRGRAIELLGDANATDAEKQDLVALIKSNRFRPRLSDGRLADAAPVQVRYYLY
jgi:hypothetical protein